MTEIASYLFREENMEVAVHGSKKKFELLKMKLELLLTQIKNDNSRYSLKVNSPNLKNEYSEFKE